MFCSRCNSSRPENMAPCPRCGAASPLASATQEEEKGQWEAVEWGDTNSAWGSWSSSEVSFSSQQWSNRPAASASQSQATGWSASSSWNAQAQSAQTSSPFPASPQMPQNAQSANVPMPPWQSSFQPVEQSPSNTVPTDQRQALLPVPYQGVNMNQAMMPVGMTLQVMSPQHVEQMLPAIPEEADTIYVPPMYTKPRAIIPRYRAISGLISFIVVTLLICSGATYYAQASGKLDPLKRLITGAPPPSIPAQAVAIPDPPNKVDTGPAYQFISSAATALTIDQKSKIALQTAKVFQVNQQFYITYSVYPQGKPGVLTIKLYTGKDLYHTFVDSDDFKEAVDKNGSIPIAFPIGTSGSAEFYWNDQFAQRIFFAVR